jgi:hypothetical protein
MVESLDTAAVIGNAVRAYEASLAPNPRIPTSAATNLELRLGDTEEHPRSSLCMRVVFKKATANAPLPSMKRMKRMAERRAAADAAAGPSRGRKSGDAMDVDVKSDEENADGEEEAVEEESGEVARQVTYFHLPEPRQPVPIGEIEEADKAGRKDDEEMEKEDEATEDEAEQGPQLSRDQLRKAYRYGDTKVPVDELDPDTLTLSTKLGVEIIGFIKKDAVSHRRFECWSNERFE